RAGVVAADDEVRAAVVLPDNAVPDGFARAPHSHGQWQEGKLYCVVRVLGEQQPVTTHAREVIHVAGPGHTHGRMDQQIRLYLLGGAESQFHMGAVHGIAGLKGYYATPAQAGKLGAKFRRSKTQCAEVVVGSGGNSLHATSRRAGTGLAHERGHTRRANAALW